MKGLRFESSGEGCTLLLGEKIGTLLEPGDVIALRGELGAGKTLLVRGIARGLGLPPSVPVTSPTFTIINEYPAHLHLCHMDLYRISEPDEMDTLPWQESLFGNGVAAIEWPERLGGLLPAERIEIEIRITGDETRSIRISIRGKKAGERTAKWVEELQDIKSAENCVRGGCPKTKSQ